MLGVPGAVISRASKENKGHAALEGREVYYTVLLGEGESRREEERSHDLYINRYSGPLVLPLWEKCRPSCGCFAQTE